MKTVDVGGARPYAVEIGPGALAGLPRAVGDRNALVVTDTLVDELHSERLGELSSRPRAALTPGEEAKSFPVLADLLERIADAGIGRDGVVIALGGGVICDVTGLAAALFSRGIDWIACPTTLLAQIDASVGGKTAVNLRAGKNLAGAFHPPTAVLADTEVLATLPTEEVRSGLGELAKAALLSGGAFLTELEASAAVEVPPAGMIAQAVAAKERVVREDEREAGPREALNLGHTFGHAIERVAGYGRVPHGVAVAAGIGLAFEAANRLGIDVEAEYSERAAGLLRALSLPAGLRELLEGEELDLGVDELVDAMGTDKKRRGGEIRLVLPVAPGRVKLGVPASPEFLRGLLTDARG